MTKTFRIQLTALVLVLFALSHGTAAAQTIRLAVKDVAVLVDVSASVGKDSEARARKQARQIVTDLVTGHRFDPEKFREWEMDPDGVNASEKVKPSVLKTFGKYLGSEGTAELGPLTAAGRQLLMLKVGNLITVGSSARKVLLQGQGPTDFAAQVEHLYPTSFNDQSTCYWYAMARTADTLGTASPDGYYLFVVSDGEDDPDYRKDGPPGHSDNDYHEYRSHLKEEYPEEAIRGTIAKHFQRLANSSRNAEQYKALEEFPQIPIAHFYQRGGKGNPNKVCLSWYAMGVTAQKLEQPAFIPPPPPPLPPGVVAPPPPAKPTATASIQLLGGLEREAKTFNYKVPLIVWQVTNANVSGLGEAVVSTRLAEGSGPWDPIGKDKHLSRGNAPQTAHLTSKYGRYLPPGKYAVKIEQTLGNGTKLEKTCTIQISPHSNRVLQLLALTSALAALGIFIFAWRSLRDKPAAA